MPAMRDLILGGARSGKSLLAENRAQESAEIRGLNVIYLATAQPLDGNGRASNSRSVKA